MSLSFWQKSYINALPSKADVVILGGGFVGLSSAYWLVKLRPSLKIVILEKDKLGSGASGKNAGFLTKGSQVFYQKLVDQYGQAYGENVFHYVDDSLKLLNEHILQDDLDLMNRAFSQTFSKQSSFSLGNFKFRDDCWISEGEFSVQPFRLLEKMKRVLTQKGVQFLEGVEAFDLGSNELQTNRGKIEFNQVLLALNGYSSRFHKTFKDLIFPKRAQMLAVRVKSPLEMNRLFYHPEERVYWRMVDSQTLIIGGKRLVDESEENSDFEKMNSKVQEALENYVRDFLKLEYEILHRWSGIMGFTKNELPLIQSMIQDSCYVAAGFSGHGMGMGFHSGREIAEMMLGLRSQSILNRV